MRNFKLQLLALTFSTLPLFADSVTVDWNQICATASEHQLVATTSAGDTVAGYCVGVTVSEISVRTPDNHIVKVARDKLSKLVVRRRNAHELRSLAEDLHHGFHEGFQALFTHNALEALFVIPGTVVWGAVGAPFAVLGDLAHLDDPDKEINIRPAIATPSTQTPSHSPSRPPTDSTERNPPDGTSASPDSSPRLPDTSF